MLPVRLPCRLRRYMRRTPQYRLLSVTPVILVRLRPVIPATPVRRRLATPAILATPARSTPAIPVQRRAATPAIPAQHSSKQYIKHSPAQNTPGDGRATAFRLDPSPRKPWRVSFLGGGAGTRLAGRTGRRWALGRSSPNLTARITAKDIAN